LFIGRLGAATLGLAAAATWSASTAHAATPTARYRVTFDATWSQATHPIDWPPNPHFSNLVGGTHTGAVQFWAPGQLASLGIKDMAERGLTSSLSAEVNTAIGAGNARAVLLGGNIPVSPGTTSFEFDMAQGFPLVSLVTMIAPSPDWFVGVHDLPLFQGGEWVEHVVVALHGYDAGTDSGTSYTSPNQVTTPPVPIALLGAAPFVGNTVCGTFTFTRVDAPVFLTLPAAGPAALAGLALVLLGVVAWRLGVRRGSTSA
jgi:hypothetical protein